MPLRSDPTTWRDPRHKQGFEGERLAAKYLVGRGYRIVEHRFRLGRSEIDLIIRQRDTVAFVEVKTRRSRAFGSPLEAVGWKKRREIQRVAQGWIDRFGSPAYQYRFDVVGVTLDRGRVTVRHVPGAFWAEWR